MVGKGNVRILDNCSVMTISLVMSWLLPFCAIVLQTLDTGRNSIRNTESLPVWFLVRVCKSITLIYNYLWGLINPPIHFRLPSIVNDGKL